MKNKLGLSVVLATRNEEENIERCLKSVLDIADEIIVFDEYSKDKTVEIAKKYKAKVFKEPHHEIFHITKQKALSQAKGEWILQLDADEVVSGQLKKDIKKVLMGQIPQVKNRAKLRLFNKHQNLLENEQGVLGNYTGSINGFFIPRRNMFLGKPLIHAGVYPDGVIRLVKNGYAKFPCKSVHEQIEINGRISWLEGDLLHYDTPNLRRYFKRLNRYTDLKAIEIKKNQKSKNILNFVKYVFLKPLYVFCKLYFRHLGFLDGVNGFLWSMFSSWHYPIAYFKFLTNNTNNDS